MYCMNRTESRRRHPYNALTVHCLFTIHGPMLICKVCKVVECVKKGLYNPLRAVLTYSISYGRVFPLVGTTQTSCQNGLTTNFIGLGIIGRGIMGSPWGRPWGRPGGRQILQSVRMCYI